MNNKIVGICSRCGGHLVIGYIEKESAHAKSPMCEKCGYREYTTDYDGRCGNCHRELPEDDKYCRYCGTKRGEGEFKPYYNVSYPLYGPSPILREHKCKECEYIWKTKRMDADQKFCPKCGKECDIKDDRITEEYEKWVEEIEQMDIPDAVKRFRKARAKLIYIQQKND